MLEQLHCSVPLRNQMLEESPELNAKMTIVPHYPQGEFSIQTDNAYMATVEKTLTKLGIAFRNLDSEVSLFIRQLPRSYSVQETSDLLQVVFPASKEMYVFPSQTNPQVARGSAKVTFSSSQWQTPELQELNLELSTNGEAVLEHPQLNCLAPLKVTFWVPKKQHLRSTSQQHTPTQQLDTQPIPSQVQHLPHNQLSYQSPNPKRRPSLTTPIPQNYPSEMLQTLNNMQSTQAKLLLSNTQLLSILRAQSLIISDFQKITAQIASSQQQVLHNQTQIINHLNIQTQEPNNFQNETSPTMNQPTNKQVQSLPTPSQTPTLKDSTAMKMTQPSSHQNQSRPTPYQTPPPKNLTQLKKPQLPSSPNLLKQNKSTSKQQRQTRQTPTKVPPPPPYTPYSPVNIEATITTTEERKTSKRTRTDRSQSKVKIVKKMKPSSTINLKDKEIERQ